MDKGLQFSFPMTSLDCQVVASTHPDLGIGLCGGFPSSMMSIGGPVRLSNFLVLPKLFVQRIEKDIALIA